MNENENNEYESDEFLLELVESGDALLTDSDVWAERMECGSMDYWSDYLGHILEPEDLMEIEDKVKEPLGGETKMEDEKKIDDDDDW